MSAETVKTIIGRAVAEPEFRGLLFRDPPAALAGYDLAEAEAAALTGLTAELRRAGRRAGGACFQSQLRARSRTG